MEINMQKKPHDRKKLAQIKYRTNQRQKSLVRFELQVSAKTKQQFDEIVQRVADEFDEPWDIRQRTAQARAQVFDEITQGIAHDFTALTRQIQSLRAEVQALSPTFFKSSSCDDTPLPEAISALPDEPQQLKHLLATHYRETQAAKKTAKQQTAYAKQYKELYDVSTAFNEDLKARLNAYGEPVE
jgi:hypothetical protein